MSLGSGLLAMASGALSGQLQARQDAEKRQQEAEQRQVENLRLLSTLSQLPGFSVGDTGAPTAPAAPAAPGMPGAAPVDTTPPILRGARAALGPNAPAAAAPAPPPRVRVGSLELGGAAQPILFDPAQSAGALEHAAMGRNEAAFHALEQMRPGSQGEYDPGFDYAQALRQQRKREQLKEGLVAAGYSPQDAELFADFNIDAEANRERKEGIRLRRRQLADTEAQQHQAQETQRVRGLAEEATGMLESGEGSAVIGAALKAMHPEASASEVTRAVGAAISEKAVRDATIGQKERSGKGKGGMVLPGGITLSPADMSAAGDTAGGDAKRAQQRADYDKAHAYLAKQGLAEEAIVQQLGPRP